MDSPSQRREKRLRLLQKCMRDEQQPDTIRVQAGLVALRLLGDMKHPGEDHAPFILECNETLEIWRELHDPMTRLVIVAERAGIDSTWLQGSIGALVTSDELDRMDSLMDRLRLYESGIVETPASIKVEVQAALDAVGAMTKAHDERVARVERVIESLDARNDDDAPTVKLPELKAHDLQAWQLASIHGMTQNRVAAALNTEHGTTYTQGQVSRMIARAKAHTLANGLAKKLAGPIDRPRTVDPGRLELGARVDKRKPRPSDMARANDDDK